MISVDTPNVRRRPLHLLAWQHQALSRVLPDGVVMRLNNHRQPVRTLTANHPHVRGIASKETWLPEHILIGVLGNVLS